jgi:hypothetical protein
MQQMRLRLRMANMRLAAACALFLSSCRFFPICPAASWPSQQACLLLLLRLLLLRSPADR